MGSISFIVMALSCASLLYLLLRIFDATAPTFGKSLGLFGVVLVAFMPLSFVKTDGALQILYLALPVFLLGIAISAFCAATIRRGLGISLLFMVIVTAVGALFRLH